MKVTLTRWSSGWFQLHFLALTDRKELQNAKVVQSFCRKTCPWGSDKTKSQALKKAVIL